MLQSLYGQLGMTNDPLMQAAAAALANSTADSMFTEAYIGSGPRDTSYTKIFVGGLPYHTSDKTLHEYFEQYGDIEEAVVITDRQTQKSRGYGFVTMKDRGAAERACKDPNPIIDGRKANVNLAYLGAKPRGNVQLAALSNAVQQIPLQAQLQALFPQRIGIPQLYYPSQQLLNASALSALQPQLAAAAAAQNSAITSQQIAAATAAAAAASGNSNAAAQQYLDYATLAAAAAGQNAFAMHPAVSAANGLEQYAFSQYGLVPSNYASQLSNVQSQLAAAAAANGNHNGTSEHQRVQ